MAKQKNEESTSGESTALVERTPDQVLAESSIIAIRPESGMDAAIAANYAEGESLQFGDLIRVKVPSGGLTKWTVETLEGEETVDKLQGAIVYYKPSGTLWPTDDETVEGTQPLLRTRDLVTAEQVGDDYGDINPDVLKEARKRDEDGNPMSTPDGRGLYDWQKLEYNKWGTGKKGIGKRCKETRMMCLLPDNANFPIFLQVPPGSLKNVTRFMRMLTLPYWNYVISLELEKSVSTGGQAFSQIKKPRLIRSLDAIEAAALKRIFVDTLDPAVDQVVAESIGDEDDVPF